MPANLTPEYKNAELKFRTARTPEEKLAALEDMLATIPKHKGTDKMQADIKRRISKLKNQAQKKSGPKHGLAYHVEREGAGQVMLIGAPNSGKSSLLKELTNAKPEIGDYPFTTRTPLPGMMHFENVLIQLVDLPPVIPELTEGWVPGLLRIADAALFTVALTGPVVKKEVDTVRSFLEEHRIYTVKNTSGKIEDQRLSYVKTLMVGTKYDMPGSPENFSLLCELFRKEFDVLPFSIHSYEMVEDLRRWIFLLLGIIRIYSKVPGGPPDRENPFVVKAGSTVMDVAREIHLDFARELNFARIWGSQKYEGQRVNRDYVLADEDILELHL
ncbi:MAG: 50S ribosome-binding GTPase [Chloroflexi bacterium]|nr:50S ribosome-binding GTPase [Chloroflexota bacterium]